MQKDDVLIKGRKHGMLIRCSEQTEFAVLKAKLEEKLRAADKFLNGAEVTIDVGNRALTSQELLELEALISQKFSLKLVSIVNGQDPGETDDDLREVASLSRKGNGTSRGSKTWDDGLSITLIVKRTIRSGQRIRHNGSVVILGDVNPGAEVVASGDIIVLGSLRGLVHAGATGNKKAVVAAFRLQPTQLRISGIVSRPPENDQAPGYFPEVARIRDGSVVIQSYLALPHG